MEVLISFQQSSTQIILWLSNLNILLRRGRHHATLISARHDSLGFILENIRLCETVSGGSVTIGVEVVLART